MRIDRALSGWFREGKRHLGYYRLRTRWLEPRFVAALRPSDTFLVGHPKSGNTWLAYMLAVLIERDAAERVTLANVGAFVPFVHGRDHRIGRYPALADPRVFRNENPRYWPRYPRIIYLLRDPRAVIPSLWSMYRTMRGDTALSIETFLDQYLARRGVFRDWNSELVRWDRQVAAVLDEAERSDRIEVVRYETMVADRPGVISALNAFLGLDRTETEVARAVARGGFAAMRAVEDAHGSEAYRGRAALPGRFVRTGTVDGWRKELPSSVIGRIEDGFGPVMRRAGYLQ
jgi:hypothetical protein